MSERFIAKSSTGEELEIFVLGSGLISSIDPAVASANPFSDSGQFRGADGQQVRQTRPGVFRIVGSNVEYERVPEDPEAHA
ncbi:MAG: hypothetical protein WBP11_09905 [Dokdonella sp.]